MTSTTQTPWREKCHLDIKTILTCDIYHWSPRLATDLLVCLFSYVCPSICYVNSPGLGLTSDQTFVLVSGFSIRWVLVSVFVVSVFVYLHYVVIISFVIIIYKLNSPYCCINRCFEETWYLSPSYLNFQRLTDAATCLIWICDSA